MKKKQIFSTNYSYCINMTSDKKDIEKIDELLGKLAGKQQMHAFPFKN